MTHFQPQHPPLDGYGPRLPSILLILGPTLMETFGQEPGEGPEWHDEPWKSLFQTRIRPIRYSSGMDWREEQPSRFSVILHPRQHLRHREDPSFPEGKVTVNKLPASQMP
jgi:hypothetical protein